MSKSPKILFFDFLDGISYQKACGSGLGSSLLKLPAFVDASEFGYEVHLVTSYIKKKLIDDASGIKKIYCSFENLDLSTFHTVINFGLDKDEVPEKIKNLKNYIPFSSDDFNEYKRSPHVQFWRSFTGRALNKIPPEEVPEIELCLESEKLIEASKILSRGNKWIALSCQSISPLKDYGKFQQVIELLLNCDDNLKIVLLGDKEVQVNEHDRVVNLMGKTDIDLLKAIISLVKVTVGVDGLITNIAYVLQKPAVIMFSMIAPNHVLSDLSKNNLRTMVSKGCPYQFCYDKLENYRNCGCKYLDENPGSSPLCLDFKPEEILRSVCELLG